MDVDYGFEYAFPDAAEGALMGTAGIATGIMMILWLLGMGFSIVSYVLNSVGMYRIAKRRGIHHAWLAWVPIGSNWLLGSISDHYQYVVKHKITARRKVLLVLSIILVAATCLLGGGITAAVLSAETADGNISGTILSVALIAIAYLIMLGMSITILVFCYIAYYDLFRSCKPSYDVLFLVLSVLFNVTLPFFVFACSGSDQGMPERRASQPPIFQEEVPAVEAEIVDDPEF